MLTETTATIIAPLLMFLIGAVLAFISKANKAFEKHESQEKTNEAILLRLEKGDERMSKHEAIAQQHEVRLAHQEDRTQGVEGSIKRIEIATDRLLDLLLDRKSGGA